MEDSFKGTFLTLTIVVIFIIAVLNFIVLFPQEQGVTFDGNSQVTYLTITALADNVTSAQDSQALVFNNQTDTGYDQWAITVGFMGSDTIKQTAKTNLKDSARLSFNSLIVIAKEVFGSGSPVLYVLSALLTATLTYLVVVAIKYIRTGI